MSPIIQNAALRSAAIDAVYVPFRVKKSELKNAIQGLRSLSVKGFNVTAPHKVKIIQYLNRLDSTAEEIGSVNTVLNKNGSLRGYSTDGSGALKALEEVCAPLEGQSLLIFGAGGASRAIAHTLTPRVKSLRLVNRTLTHAKQLERRLRQRFRTAITSTALSGRNLRHLVEEADVIINATSMGMRRKDDLPIGEGWLRKDQWIFDIVYDPLETNLLKLAGQAGAKTVSGLDMLLNQGAASFELWTGRKAPVLEMRRAIAGKLLVTTHAESS